ncbi:MAG: HD-GYP domain-containing protein, partial [Candidatus Eisenbacteria bacterium]|nr:HD-GYP domain-containing protein [Candidatus Eisenbacteria bacterium]
CASPGSSSGTGAATSSDTDRGETATSTDPRSGEAATSSDARGGEADSTSNRFLIDLETEPSGEHPGESTAPSPGPRFHEPVPEFGIAIPKGSILSRRTTSEDAVGTGASSNTQCKRAFFTAVSVYKSMHHGLHIGQPIEIRHAKRTVQNLVDQVLDEEFAILGLTALKTQDNYAFFHSVNVAVLSIALGKRIGLSPQQLVELGTGALFHDIGKVRIPLSILRKPDKLTDEERAIIQLHPQYGVQELLRMGGLDPQLFPALVGCFEHHMCTDAPDESYPQVARYRPHVYGRIISIADCFDALSTRRIYMKSVRSKGQALAWMMEQGGTKFDPVLLKLFVNQVGIHPVGSIVRLKSGRLAVVLRTPEEPGKSHRPVVALVDPATSQADPLPLDLSVRGADGRYLDEVEQTLEADEVGIDLQRLLA